jgi:putative transposon-encoded protein
MHQNVRGKVNIEHCNIIAIMTQNEPKSVSGVMQINCEGYEAVEKVAKPCATSARIIVPKDWINKRVLVIRLDP